MKDSDPQKDSTSRPPTDPLGILTYKIVDLSKTIDNLEKQLAEARAECLRISGKGL